MPSGGKRRSFVSRTATKRIIELAQAGASVYSITKTLNSPSSRLRPARGKRWRRGVVQRVLEDCGLYRPRELKRISREVGDRIVEMFIDKGMSIGAIARTLNDEGVSTATGGTWKHSNVNTALWSRGVNRRSAEQLAVDFMAKVRRSRYGHWQWLGRHDERGRPVFPADGQLLFASRVSYELANGKLPKQTRLRNLCGDASCIRPDHWRPRGTPEAEFWASTKRDPGTGCRLWLGALNRKGYGKTQADGRTVQAHRHAWELRNGPLPAEVDLHHLPTCPKNCVEPTHLTPVPKTKHLELERAQLSIIDAIEAGTFAAELADETTPLDWDELREAVEDDLEIAGIVKQAMVELEELPA
jgi:Recombinase